MAHYICCIPYCGYKRTIPKFRVVGDSIHVLRGGWGLHSGRLCVNTYIPCRCKPFTPICYYSRSHSAGCWFPSRRSGIYAIDNQRLGLLVRWSQGSLSSRLYFAIYGHGTHKLQLGVGTVLNISRSFGYSTSAPPNKPHTEATSIPSPSTKNSAAQHATVAPSPLTTPTATPKQRTQTPTLPKCTLPHN